MLETRQRPITGGPGRLVQIAVRGPGGPQHIAVPHHWTIHDLTTLRRALEAAGYEEHHPTTGPAFAFVPARPRVVPPPRSQVSILDVLRAAPSAAESKRGEVMGVHHE